MRIALSMAIGVGMLLTLASQADEPTADEKKAVSAAQLLKGKPGIDTTLHPNARVAVRFDTATDATLVALAKYPQIGAIQALDGTACTTRGFTALQSLPNLRRLTLNKSRVTDKDLALIAGCKNLQLLVLPESGITDNGLAAITKLTRLEHLDLSDNPRLTDKAIEHIKTLERLEVLLLNKTGITDTGLFELAPLEGLRTLNVAATKVTAEAAEKFPTQMPNLRVVRR